MATKQQGNKMMREIGRNFTKAMLQANDLV
jgi:hypothetical protein